MAEAETADGAPAVLKLVVPRDGDAAAHEIAALRLCAGEGCVALLRHDVGRGRCSWSGSAPSLCERGGARGAAARDPVRDGAAGLASCTGRDLPRARTCPRARRRPAGWRVDRDGLGGTRSPVLRGGGRPHAGLRGPPTPEAPRPGARRPGARRRTPVERAGGGGGLQARRSRTGWRPSPSTTSGIIMREDPIELLDGDPMARARSCWPLGPVWTRRRSGSGAWSSGSRPGCSARRVALQPVARQMLATRTGWRSRA